jgi:hypothetical protein
LTQTFERYHRSFTQTDLRSFEALCFHRAEEVVTPYSMLLRSPAIGNTLVAQVLVEHAYENSEEAIRNAYVTDGVSGARIFAYALARLCEGPGCIPGLISAHGPDGKLDLFECNIMQERGGAINSTFTVPYSCGLTWDSYHFFEDPLGKGSRVSFSNDHLTETGVEFAKWLFPERIEALRRRE